MINIYSVNYHSGKFINYNYFVLKRTVKSMPFRWFICNHSSDDSTLNIKPEMFVYNRTGETQGSVAHGNGLNYLLDQTNHLTSSTDICLILDPDCIVYYPIHKIIRFMERYNLDLFGTGYAPTKPNRRLVKGPNAFCCFIRNGLQSTLDYSAGLDINGKYDRSVFSVYPDVGYKVGLACENNVFNWETVDFVTRTKSWGDMYMFNNRLFALHIRMKMHCGLSRRVVSKNKLTQIEDLYYSLGYEKFCHHIINAT